jgi:enoyl-CoA hydratase
MDQAIALAQQIGELSAPAVAMAKEAVNAAFELPLREGVRLERRLFLSLFGTEDQQEGMAAFNEKRKPSFRRS